LVRKQIVKKQNPIPWIIALAIFSLILYYSTLRHSFVHLDNEHILENPGIQKIKSLPGIFTSLSISDYKYTYRPFTSVSYMMNHLIGGEKPFIYHFTNILLHTVFVLLSYFLFWRITGKNTRKTLFSTFLVAAHPLHAESVAWVSGRAGLLGANFALAAFLVILLQPGKPPQSSHPAKTFFEKLQKPLYVASLIAPPLFYLCGILCWEYAVILPLVCLLYDLIFHRKNLTGNPGLQHLLKVYIPLLGSLVIYIGLRIILKKSLVSPGTISPLMQYGKIQSYSGISIFSRYVLLALLPFKPSMLHVLNPPPGTVTSIGVILTLVLGFALLLKKFPVIAYGLGFFALSLALQAIFPLDNLVAERTITLALPGFCLALGSAFAILTEPGTKMLDSTRNSIILAILVCLLLLYSVKTISRARDWYSEISLWTSEEKLHPRSPFVQNKLGLGYYSIGIVDSAEKSFKKCIDIDPLFFPAYHNLARLLIDHKRPEQAKKILHASLEKGAVSPDDINFTNTGILYLEMGYPQLAQDSFQKALEKNPKNPTALSELASLNFEKKQYAKYIDLFTRSLERAAPEKHATILSNRGMAYHKNGETDKAIIDLQKALRLNPQLANPYLVLAAIEADRKFLEKSVALLEEALQKVPSPPFEIYFALHQLYDQFKQHQKAFDILYQYQHRMPRDIRIQMAIGKYCLNWYTLYPQDKPKLKTAATCFKNAHKLDPKNKETLIYYGKTAALMGETEAAEKIWKQALKIDPNDPEVLTLLSELKYKKK